MGNSHSWYSCANHRSGRNLRNQLQQWGFLMEVQQLTMPLEPTIPKTKTITQKAPKRERQKLDGFVVRHPDDAKACAVCGTVGSVFTLFKGKVYCPGTDWGKPSCVPMGG